MHLVSELFYLFCFVLLKWSEGNYKVNDVNNEVNDVPHNLSGTTKRNNIQIRKLTHKIALLRNIMLNWFAAVTRTEDQTRRLSIVTPYST